MMKSFMFSLGWYLRLYQDRFHDDKETPSALLRNFLTIPLQFATTALQWSNATCPSPLLGCEKFPMPLNLTASATSAQIQHRFKGKLWTLVLFMAIGGAVVVWIGSMLGWILVHKDPLRFNPSGVPDLDFASLAGRSPESGGRNFAQAARDELPPNPGTWSAREFCKQKRLRVEEREDQTLVLSEVRPSRHEPDRT